jgi:hypothetical protein
MAILTSHVGLQVGLVIEEFVLQTCCSPNAFIRIKRKKDKQTKIRMLNVDLRKLIRNNR